MRLHAFSRHWYAWGLGALFCVSLVLRLWRLDRLNELVFDEIYYVKYGYAYLTQKPIFDAHPPLGKYLIAAGTWLGENLIFVGAQPRNEAAGVSLSPLSYRWLNGFVGAWIPLLVAGIGRQLSGRRSLGLIAGALIAADGFLLVESRFALLHVYLVTLGLLGQWCVLKALRAPVPERWHWLMNAGLSFGACISVKWNGLGYWFVPGLGWIGAWLWFQLKARRPSLVLWQGLIALWLMPAIVYGILWLPHLRFNTDVGLIKVHEQMLGFHEGMGGNSKTVHPYCSPWWSWPLMLRPIAYFFRKSTDGVWRFDVHAMGNPLLWWLSTLAIALLLGTLIWSLWQRWLWRLEQQDRQQIEAQCKAAPLLLSQGQLAIATYILLNYSANWLPWAFVSRCTFMYHHLGATCFGALGLAFWCDRWPRVGLGLLGMVAIAFLFWMPVYLGLPLTETGLKLRMWLTTWI